MNTKTDTAIVLASFGTRHQETRRKTLDAIEKDVRQAFLHCAVSQAFTSSIIKQKLKSQEGYHIDNVAEALDRLRNTSVQKVIVQPTHIIPGFEYEQVASVVREYRSYFKSCICSKPLLAEDTYSDIAKIMAAETETMKASETAFLWMGHGSSHPANEAYTSLIKLLQHTGLTDHYLATVEGHPGFNAIVDILRNRKYRKVVLLPFMVVAGEHARNDMAGSHADSWQNVLSSKGYTVLPVMRGLGEYAGIRKCFIKRIEEALSDIS